MEAAAVVPTGNTNITVSSSRIEELLDSFIDSQDVKQSSKGLYRRTLERYISWVEEKGYLLSDITRGQILEYKEDLLRSGKSSLTVGSYITAVRRFYEWTEASSAASVSIPSRSVASTSALTSPSTISQICR